MSGVSFTNFKPSLRWLPGKKPTVFSASFNHQHRVSLACLSVINDRSHPRHFILKRKYEQKDRNGLWWAPTVYLTLSPKRTVRSWCARRLRAAFKEELAARGLNELAQRVRNGKVVDGPATAQGTLIMQANVQLITAKYEKVREEAGWAVDALLTMSKPSQSSPPNPRGGNPPMPRPGGKGHQKVGKGGAPRKQK